MTVPLPHTLQFVRHGESAANVARLAAFAAGHASVELSIRDPDVPLSPHGERQAIALGRWLAAQPEAERPTVVVASPYVRARRTAELLVEAGGAARGAAFGPDDILLDERWREKELGFFHSLMRKGVAERYPEQDALRELLGPFYYRPPNGESGTDVVQRVRAALADVAREHAGERVMVVCHQVVILSVRYVLERLTERGLHEVWQSGDLANCSVTTYRPDLAAGRLALTGYNFTVPIEEEGATVTAEPPHATGPA
jgi:broad specificity phosphatase PhoE